MFLKRVERRKSGKKHTYWALVESIRTACGSRHRVVAYLGELKKFERNGCSWAKLPLIQKVEVSIGKELCQQWLWAGTLTGVDSLTITAHTSDGRVFTSPVCMAVAPEPPKKAPDWATDRVVPILVDVRSDQRVAAAGHEDQSFASIPDDGPQRLDCFTPKWHGARDTRLDAGIVDHGIF